jgi:hypothetical protein
LYWDPKTGALKYHDWHARDGEEWYLLADVRASLAFGRALWLGGPSLATWQLRLLVEAGVLQPYPVPAHALPTRVRPTIRKVYEGFLFLLACKWWHTPHAVTTFTWRFAAAWCGVGTRQAGEAMHWLLAHGFVRQVGRYKGPVRETALFLPAV